MQDASLKNFTGRRSVANQEPPACDKNNATLNQRYCIDVKKNARCVSAVNNGNVMEESLSRSKLYRSIEYIELNVDQDITVDDIAHACNLSTHHFCRKFKSYFGETPIMYLRQRRMTLAAQLLIEEQIDILTIALNLQFNSQESFTRAFKAHFNRTPARFRKMGEPLTALHRKKIDFKMIQKASD